METMWAPWRGDYINGTVDQEKPKPEGCVFCEALTTKNDNDRYIIHRGKNAFVILNLYPYNNGHMLVIPNQHISNTEMMDSDTRYEVMDLLIKAESVLNRVYKPHGINIGANIGAAAGAGIAQHMHFHILPRWNADVNFMTAVANTRVVPESLEISWQKIRKAWNEMDS
jgi:ATP adenylyltransferase